MWAGCLQASQPAGVFFLPVEVCPPEDLARALGDIVREAVFRAAPGGNPRKALDQWAYFGSHHGDQGHRMQAFQELRQRGQSSGEDEGAPPGGSSGPGLLPGPTAVLQLLQPPRAVLGLASPPADPHCRRLPGQDSVPGVSLCHDVPGGSQ